MISIKENLTAIKAQIAAAASRAGRNPDAIKLIAVSKRISPELIIEAARCGQTIFGENYVQEAQSKFAAIRLTTAPPVSCHLIGHLQSNKVRAAIETFQSIETVDSIKLAQTLEQHLAAQKRQLSILIQVNVGLEPQKQGIKPEQTADLIRRIDKCPHLKVKGLMTMPPLATDGEDSRPYFKKLRHLAKDLQGMGLLGQHGPVELSMGMSADFEVAIEEGATIVRVGTAIFGTRPQA